MKRLPLFQFLLIAVIICGLLLFVCQGAFVRLSVSRTPYESGGDYGVQRVYEDQSGQKTILLIVARPQSYEWRSSYIDLLNEKSPYSVANIEIQVDGGKMNQIRITDRPEPVFIEANLEKIDYAASEQLRDGNSSISIAFGMTDDTRLLPSHITWTYDIVLNGIIPWTVLTGETQSIVIPRHGKEWPLNLLEQDQQMTPTSGAGFSRKPRSGGEDVLYSDAGLREKTSRALAGIVGIALDP